VSEPSNLRYELRAYEGTDACRMASIIASLTSQANPTVTREELFRQWSLRYPQHAAQTKHRTIRSRMRKALQLLRIASIVRMNGDTFTIVDRPLLMMSAGNRHIIEDDNGESIRMRDWAQRPAAPPHLHPVQEALKARQLAKDLPQDS
jgi:hypothetical protein